MPTDKEYSGWVCSYYNDLNALMRDIQIGDVLSWPYVNKETPQHWSMVTGINRNARSYASLECNAIEAPCAIVRMTRAINLRSNYTLYRYYGKLKAVPKNENAKIYAITAGNNGVYRKDVKGTLSITCDGDLSKFIRLFVDDNEVSGMDYTLSSGSTVVTFNEGYLDTLSDGKHTVTFSYSDGEANATLWIGVKLPKTGDDFNLLLYAGTMLAAAAIILLVRKTAKA